MLFRSLQLRGAEVASSQAYRIITRVQMFGDTAAPISNKTKQARVPMYTVPLPKLLGQSKQIRERDPDVPSIELRQRAENG